MEKLLQKQLLYFDNFRYHMSSNLIKIYFHEFYTSRAFHGYQEHKNRSSNKDVMQVPKLEENQQTLQHLQQERLLYFDVLRKHMSLYCIKPYMDGFYTSRSFQRYQEHPNRSSDDKVMVLRSWSKNRKAAALQRAAETQLSDVTTLPNDVATLGVDFGWIFSPF